MIPPGPKAWIALLGGIITALLASPAVPITGLLHTILVVASIILTAVITYAAPNPPVDVVNKGTAIE